MADEDVELQELSSQLMGRQNGAVALEDSLAVSYKAKRTLPYDPATLTLTLGIYPRKLKTYIHTKRCTQMFIAALLVIAKTWKQPRCPSVGDG